MPMPMPMPPWGPSYRAPMLQGHAPGAPRGIRRGPRPPAGSRGPTLQGPLGARSRGIRRRDRSRGKGPAVRPRVPVWGTPYPGVRPEPLVRGIRARIRASGPATLLRLPMGDGPRAFSPMLGDIPRMPLLPCPLPLVRAPMLVRSYRAPMGPMPPIGAPGGGPSIRARAPPPSSVDGRPCPWARCSSAHPSRAPWARRSPARPGAPADARPLIRPPAGAGSRALETRAGPLSVEGERARVRRLERSS